MPTKKSYRSWCKVCKFHERNINKCIACLVEFGTAAVDQPPEFHMKVKE